MSLTTGRSRESFNSEKTVNSEACDEGEVRMFNTLEMQIIDLLMEDARVAPEKIAVMTGSAVDQVNEAIAHLERERVLVKYAAVVNWERTAREWVQAVIEVRVHPQRDRGFDAVAARIDQFEEVTSLYLMSGAYDLMVMVEAPTLKQLAGFVSSKLSTLEGVTGTATHFVLKTYKQGGVVFSGERGDRRLAVSP